jgi:hypothetical protein
MIVLLIAGGTFLARSAFQAGFLQGAAVEGGEVTGPLVFPHAKGFAPYPFAKGGSFFGILAIFLGGILLIKLITSIIGLVMFNKWRAEGGKDWEDWRYHKYHHHPVSCGPGYFGPWGPYPRPSKWKAAGEDKTQEETEEKTES